MPALNAAETARLHLAEVVTEVETWLERMRARLVTVDGEIAAQNPPPVPPPPPMPPPLLPVMPVPPHVPTPTGPPPWPRKEPEPFKPMVVPPPPKPEPFKPVVVPKPDVGTWPKEPEHMPPPEPPKPFVSSPPGSKVPPDAKPVVDKFGNNLGDV